MADHCNDDVVLINNAAEVIQSFFKGILARKECDARRAARARWLARAMQQPSAAAIGKRIGVSGLFQAPGPKRSSLFRMEHKSPPRSSRAPIQRKDSSLFGSFRQLRRFGSGGNLARANSTPTLRCPSQQHPASPTVESSLPSPVDSTPAPSPCPSPPLPHPTRIGAASTVTIQLDQPDDVLGVVWMSSDRLVLKKVTADTPASRQGVVDFVGLLLVTANGVAVGTVAQLREVLDGETVVTLLFAKDGADPATKIQAVWRGWKARRRVDRMRVVRERRLQITMQRGEASRVGKRLGVSGVFGSPTEHRNSSGFSLRLSNRS
eukprot:Sspe_Gene.28281::Locus_12709_Transcript_2_2_Confidence_0.833_Length_1301::g.28281::m.28281